MNKNSFTLIELMFTVVILAILISVSLPNIRKTFNGLELNNTAGHLAAIMNYLKERAVIAQESVYLTIDNDKNEYWAQIGNETSRLKTYRFPEEIEIIKEPAEGRIIFYPDGHIDSVIVELINIDQQNITLTTQGVYGGVKIIAE